MENNEWLGHKPTPDDKRIMDNFMDSAEDALIRPLNDEERADFEHTDDFLTITDRNGEGFILYEILIDEMPELGLSTSAEDSEGFPLEGIGAVAIKVTSRKETQRFMENLHENPIISFLIDSSLEEKEKRGRVLEDQGLLEHGATKRFLLRSYLKGEEKYPNSYQEEIEKLHGTEPMNDEEIKELMRSAISEEQRKKLVE